MPTCVGASISVLSMGHARFRWNQSSMHCAMISPRKRRHLRCAMPNDHRRYLEVESVSTGKSPDPLTDLHVIQTNNTSIVFCHLRREQSIEHDQNRIGRRERSHAPLEVVLRAESLLRKWPTATALQYSHPATATDHSPRQ